MNFALDDHQKTEPDTRMTVTGRVLDPAGKPISGALVDVIGRPRAPEASTVGKTVPYGLLGHSVTDADGRFRLDAARSSAARHIDVHAVAASPGFGFGWIPLNPDAEQPAAEIRLHVEQVIQGRLVDVNGQPAAGVEIQVHDLGRSTGDGDYDGIGPPPWSFDPPEGLPAWPKPVTTDGQGRFTLAGIARGFSVTLYVHDLRFARQRLELKTDDRQGPRDVALALQPATIIEGRVLAADTGQPIPNAVISVNASHGMFGGWFTTKFRADAEGRFTANPSPGDYFRMSAVAPDGQPYLVRQDQFAWTKGAVKKTD
jgi:protocatechuate 3,4-dioxygenase beta subunit